ncbi:coiled-coil domain-containing protein [Oopsacas minuta]|uniref:Coiled-coil domain-containing protein n=1 Tax=Oopsacas minuta TaxID=111878 RepID=A0AAV7JY63_9METZ|nr:coiled-coil domain-containing protein [Oopsacas minuta]
MEIHLKELKKQVNEFKQKSSDAENELEAELLAIVGEEKELKGEVRKCNSQLHQARDDHETLLQDIDTLRETRERLKKETKDNSNTIARTQKQMATLEQQVNVAEEEANSMRDIHQDISHKFKQLENSVYQEETENKKILSKLEKGLKEENHTLTVTQVKVQVEQKSLDKLIEQFHTKKETMTRVLSETESNRDEQKRQIEELQSRYDDLSNGISNTKNQLTELKVKRDNHIRDIANSKSSLIPENSSLATKLSDVKLAIQKCESDNKSSSKKLDDVTSSSKMMEIMVEQLAVDIVEIKSRQESTLKVLNVEREEKGALETEKEDLKLFTRNIKEKHAIFVEDKMDETSKTNDLLSEVIRNNAKLTGDYRREQSSHMSANTKLLQWTDEKLKLVSSLKDHKQLMGIQTRMHIAAQDYYKQRGTRSHQILASLVRDGEENKERSTGMKNLLDNVLSEIITFLESYSKMSAVRGIKKSKVTFSDILDFDTTNRSTLPPIHNNKNDQ